MDKLRFLKAISLVLLGFTLLPACAIVRINAPSFTYENSHIWLSLTESQSNEWRDYITAESMNAGLVSHYQTQRDEKSACGGVRPDGSGSICFINKDLSMGYFFAFHTISAEANYRIHEMVHLESSWVKKADRIESAIVIRIGGSENARLVATSHLRRFTLEARKRYPAAAIRRALETLGNDPDTQYGLER